MAIEGAWRGEIMLGETWGLFVGAGPRSRRHEHPALKIVVGLGADVVIEAPGLSLRGPGFVLPPNWSHACGGSGPLALLFASVESPLAMARLERPRALYDAAGIADTLRRAIRGPAVANELVRDVLDGVRMLGHVDAGDAGDGRVGQALRAVMHEPGTPFSEIGRRLGVSEARVTRLVQAEAGTTLSRFRMWARLRAALACLADGASATHAAHAAGFSDLAHMSRTFSMLLGLAPSELLGMDVTVLPAV